MILDSLANWFSGKLSLSWFPHEFVTQMAAVSIVAGAIIVLALLTYYHKWGYLWREWLTTTNHKRIGAMYMIVSVLMLIRGLSDALMIRAQQATSVGSNNGIFSVDTFQQVFSAHGTIMIFFVAMGLMFGLINLIMPQQLGSRDVAYPFMNATSFWLFAAGMLIVNTSLVIGEFSAAGWLAYPPLSEIKFSPGVGVDYWIWGLQIAGIGSLLSGINFMVTILKKRAKGMKMKYMPLFPWGVFGSMTLVAFSFPILTVTLTLLALDRTFGTNFFTASGGGDAMMYVNLIWAWGHPEVYILVLPAFGIFSDVVQAYSRKRLFGYTSMVWAIWAIVFLSFTVWLHHFFTMGSSANVNGFFGIMTMLIAIPTGVKIFNWLFTMYQGRIKFANPMIWFMGFVFLFTLGGVTGVLMAIPPIDFQVHNSLFLVAHFHTMIVTGVVFGFMAGINYWAPKILGFKLHEKLGKLAAYLWVFGFIFAFGPLYILGFMGATRRIDHYAASTGWQPLFIVAGIGTVMIILGVVVQLIQLAVSWLSRSWNRDLSGDYVDGWTLEWATASRPQEYNFAHEPIVRERDEWHLMKQNNEPPSKGPYKDIRVPINSGYPIIIAAFAFGFSFGFIWHIWWLVIVCAVGAIVALMRDLLSDRPKERIIPAEVVRKTEQAWLAQRGV